MAASAWTPVPESAAGWTPVPESAAPPDGRNAIQKTLDSLSTVSPEERATGTPAQNYMNDMAAGTIGAMVQPISHPIDAITGAAHAVLHPIDTAKAMLQSAKDNPAQFGGNVAGGVLAGEVAGAGARLLNKAATPLGRAALLGKTPEEAYESALKPSVTADATQKANAVRAGLENSIPLSKAGMEKVGDLIDDLNKKIADTINADPTRPIDPNKVATRADQARARFYKQVNAQDDLNTIEASRRQFLSEQGAKPGVPAIAPQPTGILDAQGNPIMNSGTPAKASTPAPPMNAADAQAMKQGTYRVLAGKFGEQGSAAVEAQKSLARGLKEEIATQFPEITKLNVNESRLLDLQPLLERAVNRASNQGMFRVGTGAVAGTAKALGSSNKVAAVAAVMKQVLDDPAIKARIAIAVSKGGKIPYAQAVARLGAYSAALGSTSETPEN